ncbi:MAG: hydrolase [bacterium]|nr:hydrolase [bacterium]MCS7310203.1 hydrolase [Armatimonadota bacterium]
MRHPQILRADRSVLVVVDMQEPFLRYVHERERVIQQCRLLVQSASVLKVPVIATLQYAQRMGGIIPEIAEVLPESSEPIDKMCFSCYGSDPFRAALMASERSQVVLCGVEAHICVTQTALDAQEGGFQVHVVQDAVSSRARENWQVAMERLRHAGVVVTCAESVVYEWLVQAGTDEFRQILQWVK